MTPPVPETRPFVTSWSGPQAPGRPQFCPQQPLLHSGSLASPSPAPSPQSWGPSLLLPLQRCPFGSRAPCSGSTRLLADLLVNLPLFPWAGCPSLASTWQHPSSGSSCASSGSHNTLHASESWAQGGVAASSLQPPLHEVSVMMGQTGALMRGRRAPARPDRPRFVLVY